MWNKRVISAFLADEDTCSIIGIPLHTIHFNLEQYKLPYKSTQVDIDAIM